MSSGLSQVLNKITVLMCWFVHCFRSDLKDVETYMHFCCFCDDYFDCQRMSVRVVYNSVLSQVTDCISVVGMKLEYPVWYASTGCKLVVEHEPQGFVISHYLEVTVVRALVNIPALPDDSKRDSQRSSSKNSMQIRLLQCFKSKTWQMLIFLNLRLWIPVVWFKTLEKLSVWPVLKLLQNKQPQKLNSFKFWLFYLPLGILHYFQVMLHSDSQQIHFHLFQPEWSHC